MRIIFMGTPDFAVPSLQLLYESGYDIVGVITATDKYGGRGGKRLIESAVKKYAIEKQLTILQPPNLKNKEFQDRLRSLKADLQVVVAFRMLPESVWDMPPLGTMNLHASLLPKYRGAAPINWAIINGESETGLTTFFLKHAIDTGDMLYQKKLAIGKDETAGELHDRMMEVGAQLVLRSVQAVERGDYILQPQLEATVTKAPKLFRENCEIDFAKSAQEVHNFIRGLSPYPAAWTRWQDMVVKIYRTSHTVSTTNHAPGTWYKTDGELRIATTDGYISVLELQPAGKRRMNVGDFLNGYEV